MGCDVSYRAIQRARSEASKRGLSIPFSVANMVELSAVPDSSFDAVICMDNSLPHLESDEQLRQAARQVYGKLRPGSSFIGSIRDYDRFVVERPTTRGRSFYLDGRLTTQIRAAISSGSRDIDHEHADCSAFAFHHTMVGVIRQE
jgi:SAM-dependent methyltransferase